MGYYIRVLSTSADPIPLSTLKSALATKKLEASLTCDEGMDDDWTELTLAHADGREIASISRELAAEGLPAMDELEEFAEEIADGKPATAAAWLLRFLPQVRCIYAFQVLDGTDQDNGWEILGAVKNCIWAAARSILQSDGEGFSNEDGYHILWQFGDSVKGTWWMGVLQDGEWTHFEMDLGNPKHRESFLRGEVPPGVRIA